MSSNPSQDASGELALALPASAAPPTEQRAQHEAQTQMNVGGKAVPLDYLGPMIINTDGTLSRITNWPDMDEDERQRTLRLLVKRNRVRLAAQKPEEGEALGMSAG